jgi:cobalt-zinc-cadmium efflux system protein
LLVAIGAIAWEAVRRFAEPGPVAGGTIIGVALVGIAINGITALLFMRGAHSDLNVRGAFLHMAADAGVSLAVVVGAFAIAQTGILWIDPALGLVIAAVIVLGAWGLLRDSADLAMDAAPRGIDVEAVRRYLRDLPGVEDVHDLHVWAISTTETAMTAHILRPKNGDGDSFLHAACEGLEHRFRIGHATLQVETSAAHACRLAPAEVV